MKKLRFGLRFIIAFIVFLSFVISSAGIFAADTAFPLVSPALDILSGDFQMVKTGLTSNSLPFSETDFKQALGVSSLDYITVISVPNEAEGVLKLASVKVLNGQKIYASMLKYLEFIPASDKVSASSFTFAVDTGEIECSIFFINKINYAPTVKSISDNRLSLTTLKNVSVYSTMSAYDPEADNLTYRIVSYPSKGTVEILDSTFGDFKYTPKAGFTGKDSFSYVACDCYGNYSGVATVSIKVSKNKSDVQFTDMKDSPSLSAALVLNSKGIMPPTSENGLFYFKPEGSVTREEFISMALSAAGIKIKDYSNISAFSDADQIQDKYVKSVAAAFSKGYITGKYIDSKLCFAPGETITKAEAAIIACRILGASAPVMVPVFADSAALPAWAASSVYAMFDLGVINSKNGNISASSQLNRAEAADILYNLMNAAK